MGLWNARFSKDADELAAAYTASVGYDRRLYPHDIRGSIAHVRMLGSTGIIPQRDADAIITELERIRERLDAGELALRDDLEDIHMNIEAALTEALGEQPPSKPFTWPRRAR